MRPGTTNATLRSGSSFGSRADACGGGSDVAETPVVPARRSVSGSEEIRRISDRRTHTRRTHTAAMTDRQAA